ncbi:hypothetical protein H70357_10110 [Paenibacillus sp. FSL H7-0357]|uniref:hypothetical protein n=1 Tax=Paenibacillus sp. FSL H7-0357 TaxID=1536774 RepID=UPI0004F89B59|nr:hypothetical protein [Paenibacillus sp. FSL H7-0357]AIQ16975.1 hypothetical protein H70357_10110 [Paenibacillus sp. FSL H7-0357]
MILVHQFKLECKRHFAMFASLTGLSCLINLYFLFSSGQDLAFLILTVNMVIGILIPVYIYVDYYREFFTGTMPVNHMLPVKTSSLFLVKSAVFMLGTTAVWSTTLLEVFLNPDGLYQARIADSASPALGILYLLLSKLCSIPAGLALIGLALAAGKRQRKPLLSHLCIAVLIVAVVAVQFALVIQDSSHWSLGTSANESFKQYANLLTVSPIYQEQAANINDTISWQSIGMNLLVACVAGSGAALLLNGRKYELYGK